MISRHAGKFASALCRLEQSWWCKGLTTECGSSIGAKGEVHGLQSCAGRGFRETTISSVPGHPNCATGPAWYLQYWAAGACPANPGSIKEAASGPPSLHHSHHQGHIVSHEAPTRLTCHTPAQGGCSGAPSGRLQTATNSTYGILTDTAASLSGLDGSSTNSRRRDSLPVSIAPCSHLSAPAIPPSRDSSTAAKDSTPPPWHQLREPPQWQCKPLRHCPLSLLSIWHADHRSPGQCRALHTHPPLLPVIAPVTAPLVKKVHPTIRTLFLPTSSHRSSHRSAAGLPRPSLLPAELSPLGSRPVHARLQHGTAQGGRGGQGGQGGGAKRSKGAAQTLSERSRAESSERSRGMLMYLLALVLAMVGATYASVPLYRMFCQATGFGGTVQRRETVEEKVAKHSAGAPKADARHRELTITFNADVADNMPWRFTPTQQEVKVQPGQPTLAFYTAQNLSDKAITGISTYNVSPNKAGAYFNKIQCFCFEEQRLRPGETIDMPVLFYIDPEFAQDPKLNNVNLLTLSYTFFKIEDE